MPGRNAKKPESDAEYFDRLSKTIFTAGLNWDMVEKKWPNFRKAFDGFAPSKVARMKESDVRALMKDTGIVRNEKKIRATVENAKTILELQRKYGSVKAYIDSFGKKEAELQKDVQVRFPHVGPSTARMFLWSAGCELTPTKEEKEWMMGHHEKRG